MKVIFLDIDGVLNLMSMKRDEFGQLFHDHFVDNLRSIIEATGAKIVVSSTWRMAGLSTMQRMWEMRDLPGEVIDVTPGSREVIAETTWLNDDIICRGNEIQFWLDKSTGVRNYVILDDDTDMTPRQYKNFVRTSENFDHSDHIEGYGLTKECADMAIKILNP